MIRKGHIDSPGIPLRVADDATMAPRFFVQRTAGLPAGSTVYLDVPVANPDALALG